MHFQGSHLGWQLKTFLGHLHPILDFLTVSPEGCPHFGLLLECTLGKSVDGLRSCALETYVGDLDCIPGSDFCLVKS